MSLDGQHVKSYLTHGSRIDAADKEIAVRNEVDYQFVKDLHTLAVLSNYSSRAV